MNALHVVSTDAFMEFTSGLLSVTGINATGHIFASYPGRHLTILGGFVDQVTLLNIQYIICPTVLHCSAERQR